jgi:hypothetical protein
MLRTQIYLTEEESAGVTALAGVTGKKQSEIIREAIDAYLEINRPAALEEAVSRCAGMWKDRTDLPDFEAARKSFDRDFDHD